MINWGNLSVDHRGTLQPLYLQAGVCDYFLYKIKMHRQIVCLKSTNWWNSQQLVEAELKDQMKDEL